MSQVTTEQTTTDMKPQKIKLRAWLRDVGIMLQVYVLDQTGDAGTGKHFPKSKGYSEHGGQFVFNIDDAQLMQCTGLKDKNGKDIWEGDILNGRNHVNKIVYWCDKRAAFCESEQFKPAVKHSFAKLYDKFGKIFNDGHLTNHVVIGNIYENPDLLH